MSWQQLSHIVMPLMQLELHPVDFCICGHFFCVKKRIHYLRYEIQTVYKLSTNFLLKTFHSIYVCVFKKSQLGFKYF